MVSDEEPVKVVCGEYRLLGTDGTDVWQAKEVATHPQWDKPLEYSYDFGLMLLDAPATNTPTVKVATPEQWEDIAPAAPPPHKPIWAQVALVSWSEMSCGTTQYPDVDSKVAAADAWIQQTIQEVEEMRGPSPSGMPGPGQGEMSVAVEKSVP